MSRDILDNLFGSRTRVKVLKFLFRNYPVEFNVKELSKRIQETQPVTKKEVESLRKLNFIRKQKSDSYSLNSSFEFFSELKALILKSSPAEKKNLIKKIQSLGRVRLAVISGIFLNSNGSPVHDTSTADLLIVGEDIRKDKLRSFLRSLEAEVGREIKISIMDKDEFEYRYGMFDRFVRVMLESPHEKIINKLGL